MDNLEKINFVDVAKQEPDDVDYDITHVIEQEYHYKQEPSVEWNEQTCILDDFKEKYTISNEPPIHMFHAKVFLERLPVSILERYGVVQKPIVIDVSKTNQPIGRINRKFLGLYQKICPKCSKITSTNTKHSTRKCLKCLVPLIFGCKKCNKQISSFSTLKYHLIVNCNPKGHYQCLVCKYVSRSKCDLEKHMKKSHSPNEVNLIKKRKQMKEREYHRYDHPYECQTCSHSFLSMNTFLWHYQSCGDTKRNVETRKDIEQMCTYFCRECNNTITKFESGEDCAQKKCNRCGSAPLRKCIECPKVFLTHHGFYYHFKVIHGTTDRDTIACPECNFSTRTFRNLSKHYKNQHQPTNSERVCDRCGRMFADNLRLKTHLSHCASGQRMQCEHCSYKAKHRTCLTTHIRNVHNIGNSIECSSCGRKYKNQNSFHDHLRYCGKAPYLQCDQCHYKTSYKSALVRHKYTMHPDVTQTKGFTCTKCGKVFQHDSARKAHEYNHRKKQLRCNDCWFKTICRRKIVAHVKNMHLDRNGRALEVCSDCGTKVKSKYYLKLHSRYCVTKPYYECNHCIYRTQKRKEFKTHLSWMHSELDCFRSASNPDNQVDVTN